MTLLALQVPGTYADLVAFLHNHMVTAEDKGAVLQRAVRALVEQQQEAILTNTALRCRNNQETVQLKIRGLAVRCPTTCALRCALCPLPSALCTLHQSCMHCSHAADTVHAALLSCSQAVACHGRCDVPPRARARSIGFQRGFAACSIALHTTAACSSALS